MIILSTISLLLLVFAQVKSDSIQVIPNRKNRDIILEGPSAPDSGASNRISKTFEEILRNINKSTLGSLEEFTTETLNEHVVHILIKGTEEEIKGISREQLMDSLWIIEKLDLPREQQIAVWTVIKGDEQIGELTRKELERLSNLLPTISEIDLININVTDLDILDFLGTYKNFTNRQLGILAYALKLENVTRSTPQNVDFVNSITGILCGFGESHLSVIPPEKFILFNQSVFENLWGCTDKQLNTLLTVAKHPNAFGPIRAWNKKIISKLGLVVSAMTPHELEQVPPESFQGLNPNVVKLFEDKQIRALSEHQVNALQTESYGIFSNRNGKGVAGISSGKSSLTVKVIDAIVIILLCVNLHGFAIIFIAM